MKKYDGLEASDATDIDMRTHLENGEYQGEVGTSVAVTCDKDCECFANSYVTE